MISAANKGWFAALLFDCKGDKMSINGIHVISKLFKDIENLKRTSDYIGRKVLSKSGDKVGTVDDVVMKGDNAVGYLIKGRKKIYIDRSYVSSDNEDVIMLSIDPVILLIGKLVFDSHGSKLGKVVSYIRKDNDNDYTALMVRKKIYFKQIEIPKKDVSIAGENIILKKSYSGTSE